MKYKEAIRDYSKAIELNNNDMATYIRRGYAYFEMQQLEQALNDFTKACLSNTTFKGYAYNNRANVKRAMKDYDGAINDVNESIKIDSLNAYAYTNRARILFETKGAKASKKDFDRAIELNNQVAEFYYHRAAYYEAIKAYDKAISDYNKAQNLNPNYKAKEISKLLKNAKRNFLKGS